MSIVFCKDEKHQNCYQRPLYHIYLMFFNFSVWNIGDNREVLSELLEFQYTEFDPNQTSEYLIYPLKFIDYRN